MPEPIQSNISHNTIKMLTKECLSSNESLSKKSLISNESNNSLSSMSSTDNKVKNIKSKNHDLKKKETLKFPEQLMKILSKREFEDIVQWMPNGKSFFIRDKNRLDEIWKFFDFPDTKFDSFRRKLHRWGFKVVRRPESDAGAYYHKCFLRDNPSLCSNMKSISTRNPTKSGSHTSSMDRKKSTDVINKNNTNKISLPNIEMNTNIDVQEQLLLKHKNYWSKRKLLFEQYFISSFQPMQVNKDSLQNAQNNKSMNELLLTRPRDTPKMAPKKKFKTRMDKEKPFEVNSCRNYVTLNEPLRYEQSRVKKARAA